MYTQSNSSYVDYTTVVVRESPFAANQVSNPLSPWGNVFSFSIFLKKK